ncbi:hypothetical protein T440DRAFT_14183 [Plenodomus tracheiphilus IPT5]|uniref:Coenzyme Q-binding protein COQ10 START domain-containing protein n=1 Tax=Plenodomus tracheiphilus IPT5 TaxID=1408161 RepID=A0A6A7BP31_9PLEO|nr:hypothetical protein T440DRAFT_14183 [Plenodomus tracheiphilus IPT5]
MPPFNPLTLTLLSLLSPLVLSSTPSDFTNLPPATPGVFSAQIRIHIRTTVPAAWSALTDFASYPSWNPFTRSAIVTIPSNSSVPPQFPVEGYHLILRTQIPPLPLPVDENTPDNLLNTQFAYENITHVQEDLGRVAWEYIPDAGVQAERWQALSDLGNGTVLYESREVFSGALAGVLKTTLGKALQEGFDAQGRGLRLLLEGEE